METAFDLFSEAIGSGDHITVAFSVIDEEGHKGLAAQGFPIGNQYVRSMAFSDDWRDRASISILAIDFAHTKLGDNYEGLTPLVTRD